jgi:hypothetical protein
MKLQELAFYKHILSCDSVTIDGVLIGNWIYWTLKQLVTTIITVALIHTLYSSLEHTLAPSQPGMSSLAIAW